MNKPNLEDKKFKQTINMIPEENLPINFNLHWHKFVEIISFPEAKGSAIRKSSCWDFSSRSICSTRFQILLPT